MAIPLKELAKVAALVSRIEVGKFDANDIDNLLIKLRPYSAPRSVFREIANFVAHADARDKGVTWDSMTGFADAMRYFVDYAGPHRTLDISQPFPAYVYRLFRSQTLLADQVELKKRFRMSQQTLLNKIETNFKVERAANVCKLRAMKDGAEFIEALGYVVGFIHSRPAFDLADFHVELRSLLSAQRVPFREAAFIAQENPISLSLLCLLSGTEFSLPEGEPGKCALETTNRYRILEGKRSTPIGAITSEPSSFGHLQIRGEVTVTSHGKQLTVAYPVVATKLEPHEHCDPALFGTLAEQNEFGPFRAEFVNFAAHMALSSDFKLIHAS